MADLGINRGCSPMDICEESLDETPEKIDKRKKLLIAKQRKRSPFLIGSIDEVNHKISSLDQKLQGYTQLVCESRASQDSAYADLFPKSATGRDRYYQREKDTREINKFAGIYTLKSTFVPGLSVRMKNISKISMQPSKTTVCAKKETGKPKFVELHQYPGYDPVELTPLPDGISAVEILQKAADATMGLSRKPNFKMQFNHWFYSQMSQAILQDAFWYFFLEKFQSSHNSQIKLFNRISYNYVKLLIYAKNPLYRDTFLKEYPLLMCQAVYSAFCHSFPDSYRQFGESFRDSLVALITEWMTGVRLTPRIWLTWDMGQLEPPNIKQREELLSQKKKKSSTAVNFDYLENLTSSFPSQYTSNTSLNQTGSRSSVTSIRNLKNHPIHGVRSGNSNQKFHHVTPTLKIISPSSQELNIIETVAEAQASPRKQPVKSLDPRKLIEALTPIREMIGEDEDENAEYQKKMFQASTSGLVQEVSQSRVDAVKFESHPACKGPDYVKSAFNLNGHCPLVAHFLKMKRLTSSSGINCRIQRTELENLPPLEAPTYQDVIQKSLKAIGKIEKDFSDMFTRNQKENAAFLRKQNAVLREHLQKQSALLSRTKEVKRLSDLLILEQRKGQDSVSAGAALTIETALLAQE